MDTSKTLEFHVNKRVHIGVLAACPLIILIGWFFSQATTEAGRYPVGYLHLIGYVFMTLGSILTIVFAAQLPIILRPVITLSATGFRDTRISGETIPWRAITSVSNYQRQEGSKLILLGIEKNAKARLRLKPRARLINALSKMDGLLVISQYLEINHDNLLETMQRYARSHS